MKKKSRKHLNRVNTFLYEEILYEKKPPIKERAKCMQCDGTMPMTRRFEYDAQKQRWGRSDRFSYWGWGYFCRRECAVTYANESARKALKHPPFNTKS